MAEANGKRNEALFADLYHRLYERYYQISPDSLKHKKIENRLFIIDSTTITLFTDIMKGRNMRPLNGKSKGGAKAHIMIKADEDIPRLIHLTHASSDDRSILPKVNLPPGSIVVFDKGYNNYKQFEKWTSVGVNWVTRLPITARINILSEKPLDEEQRQSGIIADQTVELGNQLKIVIRIVIYYDAASKRTFAFATNNFRMKAITIAGIYKRRWQIEMLFKRIKQHSPLHYFLGDSENAIKIQIWCAFIADLLIKIVKDRIKNRCWSFSNIAGMIRQHLMTYIHLYRFLSNPEKTLLNYPADPLNNQLKLALSG